MTPHYKIFSQNFGIYRVAYLITVLMLAIQTDALPLDFVPLDKLPLLENLLWSHLLRFLQQHLPLCQSLHCRVITVAIYLSY